MTPGITVITATMPGREHLCEAMASVAAQTQPAAAHLIRSAMPPEEWGPNPQHLAEQHNALLAAVDTEWAAVIDDDNLWYPHYLETLSAAFADDVDVVYGYAEGDYLPRVDVTGQAPDRIVAHLRQCNFLDSNAIVRTEAVRDVGGFPTDFDHTTRRFGCTRCTWDDWALWLRMAEAGKRFVCVPQILFTYRRWAGSSQFAWDHHQ